VLIGLGANFSMLAIQIKLADNISIIKKNTDTNI